MSLQEYIENLEFKNVEEFTEEYFHKVLVFTKSILQGYDSNTFFKTEETKKEGFKQSIRDLVWNNANLSLEDKKILDNELNAFITLHFLEE